ncbi:MAG: hypothetical protein ABR501_13220, partial [Pyrinomonadaceae bacterium]
MPNSTLNSQATSSTDFETSWRKWVHDGFIPGTSLQPKSFSVNGSNLNPTSANSAPPSNGQFEIVIRTDPTIYDGRFANNGWLQELPKPLSKLTWDNAALISPNTAGQLGIHKTIGKKGGDIYVDTLKITHQGRTLTPVPTWITP